MRKVIIFVFVFSLAFLSVNAQSITITSPTAGNEWAINSSHNITWSKTGEMNEFVKIRLFDRTGAIRVMAIADRTANNGTFRGWEIPATVPPGDYIIKVKTVDNAVEGNSRPFSIAREITEEPRSMPPAENTMMETRRVLPESSGPIVKVIYPNGGETLSRGSRVEIRWECVDGFNPPKIKILKNGRTVKVYGPDRLYPVPSSGGYIWPWIVPSNLAPGSDYSVRIEKGDFPRSNDSSDRNFTISSDLNIEVTEPRGGALIVTNGKFIRWRAGGVEGDVNVHLVRADGRGSEQLIRSGIPATPSSFLWYVGALERAGTVISRENYKVVVSAADGSVTGESNSFQIIAPTLEVTSPGSGRKRLGDTLSIRWNNSPGFHGNVNVILEQQRERGTFGEYQTLFTNTHDKNLSWRIPPDHGLDPFPTGRNYRIVVKSVRCPSLIVARGAWFEVR